MSDNDYSQYGELTYIERMDMRRMELDAAQEKAETEARVQEARASAEVRKKRWESLAVLFGSVSAAAAVVGVSYVIWLGVRGPSADDLLRQENMQTCVENGGTWITGTSADGGETNGGNCLVGVGVQK